MMKNKHFGVAIWQALLLMLLLPISPLNAAETKSPVELLGNMVDAMERNSYRGTLVYLRNNKLDSMSIAKRQKNGVTQEKMLALNGEAREVIRNDDELICVLPAAKTVTLEHTRIQHLHLGLPQDLARINQFYELKLEGSDRVAGKLSYVLLLKPKDSFRYGYRLWIDQQQHMMLKNDLLDSRGMPLEQLMFTELTVDNNLPDQLFSQANGAGYKTVELSQPSAAGDLQQWLPQRAPNGFKVIAHNIATGSNAERVEHLLLSDGMSSVSVYVKPYKQGEILDGATQMGAINAYGTLRAGHKIVAVGAVPAATVMLIAQNISQKTKHE